MGGHVYEAGRTLSWNDRILIAVMRAVVRSVNRIFVVVIPENMLPKVARQAIGKHRATCLMLVSDAHSSEDRMLTN